MLHFSARWLCSVAATLLLFVAHSAAEELSTPTDAVLGVVTDKPTGGVFVEFESKFLVPYRLTIPGTAISCEMIPIPGGTVLLGTPEDEAGRLSDEGPQRSVTIEPFWTSATELTWAEYKVYMSMYRIFKDVKNMPVARKVTRDKKIDAITAPTPLYMPTHTFEYGEDPAQPAVSMTQYAAKQYTKWLSGLTKTQYRLPTEAEWEFAARAGSTTAFCFGDDAEQLDEYAHFTDNTTEGAGKVATKKPNAFGLHDMHGNVWEWVVDGYSEDGYAELASETTSMLAAIRWPTKPDSRVVRGGGWQDTADRCRSGARMSSQDEDWKSEDPNIPLSPWWYTSDPARSVGMRIVRSARPLSSDEIVPFWNYDNEDIKADVEARILEGRAAVGLPVPELADDIRKSR